MTSRPPVSRIASPIQIALYPLADPISSAFFDSLRDRKHPQKLAVGFRHRELTGVGLANLFQDRIDGCRNRALSGGG